MGRYVVTNVRFTEAEHEKLRRLALEERRSMADVVRDAVSAYLERKGGRTLTEDELANDPFFKVVGIGRSGKRDLSARHDEVLYGRDAQDGEEEDGKQRDGKVGDEA